MHKNIFTITIVFVIACLFINIKSVYPAEIKGNLDFRIMPPKIRVIIFFYRLVEDVRTPYTDSEITSKTNCRFKVEVSDNIKLSELYLDIHVIKPDDYICARRNLDASDSYRLKDIPIRRQADYCHIMKNSALDASKNKEYGTAFFYYQEAVRYCPKDEQLAIAVFDYCDYLSRFKKYRAKVVDLLERYEFLIEQVDKKNIYYRYILLRKDSIKRLYGYNDPVINPSVHFTNNVLMDIEQNVETPYTRMVDWYLKIKNTEEIAYPPFESDTVFINAGNL